MASVDITADRPPLVLLVDPVVLSRQWMWRALSAVFGVVEAGTARGALDWLEQRPEIDALVVQDELPDGSGAELVAELANRGHPVASRAIVLASESSRSARLASLGCTLLERGDFRSVLGKLGQWFFERNSAVMRALAREGRRRVN
jgi:response regulator RpfG family c-di-GMP phosphodiesterase